ncbi:LuxR C-terminal-related transcriptional regulator [uncultured Amnibacterium sp.]|uniref:LuxR C-terminal-related transcriptional regulator n=1 Tax=uncultured Amnibacterium sp. TaxID=1631851 RepID=UPI0035C95F8F
MGPGSASDGIEAAQQVRRQHPQIAVVVLSAFADESYATALFDAGAERLAYLLKDRVGDRAELARAVRTTLAGGSVIDPLVVDAMLRRRRTTPLEELSARERQVLEQMAAGRTNSGIADTLFLSTSAVEKHISAIFTKLGLAAEPALHRRVAAVLAFLRRP